jgi:hypothetical protein
MGTHLIPHQLAIHPLHEIIEYAASDYLSGAPRVIHSKGRLNGVMQADHNTPPLPTDIHVRSRESAAF